MKKSLEDYKKCTALLKTKHQMELLKIMQDAKKIKDEFESFKKATLDEMIGYQGFEVWLKQSCDQVVKIEIPKYKTQLKKKGEDLVLSHQK